MQKIDKLAHTAKVVALWLPPVVDVVDQARGAGSQEGQRRGPPANGRRRRRAPHAAAADDGSARWPTMPFEPGKPIGNIYYGAAAGPTGRSSTPTPSIPACGPPPIGSLTMPASFPSSRWTRPTMLCLRTQRAPLGRVNTCRLRPQHQGLSACSRLTLLSSSGSRRRSRELCQPPSRRRPATCVTCLRGWEKLIWEMQARAGTTSGGRQARLRPVSVSALVHGAGAITSTT